MLEAIVLQPAIRYVDEGLERIFRPNAYVRLWYADAEAGQPSSYAIVALPEAELGRWRALNAKQFAAAQNWAADRSAWFRILTERELQTPYLVNARRLLPWFRVDPDVDWGSALTEALRRAPLSMMETEALRTQEGVKGEHPPTSAPLELVQIYHWQTDIYILDDAREHVIGRAWLTLIIDVHTRVIVGFHLGLDAPSTTTVGLAAVNMLTRKEAMLERHDIKFPWPVWGPPKRMHLDNGPDLASDSVESSANLYNIKTTFRFVRQPQYGQYIERLNSTLAKRFRNLPGATGATSAERKKLRPEKTAAFTLNDLEREVLLQIAEYHHDVHLGLGPITPMQKWTDHFLGPHGAKHPLPTAYADCLELRRDWFPRARPTLQRYGLRIDQLDYVNERLMDLIPESRKLGRIEVRRDPFDIRQVHVQHPRTGEWMIVPTRHLALPAASLFEVREARRLALA